MPRRPPKLRVLIDHAEPVAISMPDGSTWRPDNLVPRTFGDCNPTGHCSHIRCRHHNWRIDERAGRPHFGKRNPPQIRTEWLESDVQPSCSLATANLGPRSTAEVAVIERIGKRRCEMLLKRAIEKLRRAGLEELAEEMDAQVSAESNLGSAQAL